MDQNRHRTKSDLLFALCLRLIEATYLCFNSKFKQLAVSMSLRFSSSALLSLISADAIHDLI